MDVAELITRYPRLHHMTEAGAAGSIERHGLRTAADLAAAGGVEAAIRVRRTASVRFDHPEAGPVVLRDQLPLRPHLLVDRLVGMTAEEWLATLNERVYFWPEAERLEELLRARSYRGREHDVLVVDTAGLVAAHGPRVELSAINSGAVLWPNAAPRGAGTFRPVADYPFDDRLAARGPRRAIAEVTVVGGVPDLADHLVRVERRRATVPEARRGHR